MNARNNKVIFTGKQWESIAPHAPGRLVRGPLLLTSGITARASDGSLISPNDMKAQCVQVVANIVDVLDAAGAGLGDIVKLAIYTTDIDRFLDVKDSWMGLFRSRPASTLVQVERLQIPGMVIKVEAVAEVS